MLNRGLAVARTALAIFARRADLILENLALRQQLAVLQRKHPRPRLRASDRAFWIVLRRWWPRWKEALAIVQPETVIRWHREGFRRYWRWKSRRRAGRPSTMAEIQKVGLEVSERTVSRYMPRRPVAPEARQRWQTFLSNHREVIAAIHDMGITPKQITARSPWQNGVAERFVSTARRDLLDHVIVLTEQHLQRLLTGFASPTSAGVRSAGVFDCHSEPREPPTVHGLDCGEGHHPAGARVRSARSDDTIVSPQNAD